MNKILVVGYPKSGNTWVSRIVREMTGGYIINENPVDQFDNKEENSDIHIEKAHYTKFDNPKLKSWSKIIYSIRDFRDVIISGFFFNHKNITEQSVKLGTKNKLIRCYFDFEINNQIKGWAGPPMKYYRNFFRSWHNRNEWSWSDHVGFWSSKRSVLIIRYEDLKMDCINELKKISIHLDINIDQSSLKKIYYNQLFSTRKLGFIKEGDQVNTKFLRKGIIGDWKNFLNEHQLKKIYKMHGHMMKKYNYL